MKRGLVFVLAAFLGGCGVGHEESLEIDGVNGADVEGSANLGESQQALAFCGDKAVKVVTYMTLPLFPPNAKVSSVMIGVNNTSTVACTKGGVIAIDKDGRRVVSHFFTRDFPPGASTWTEPLAAQEQFAKPFDMAICVGLNCLK